MPLRSDWSRDACPIARSANVFGDPWSLLILREVFLGNGRFDGVRQALGAADNVLSDRLRTLVDAGLLTRRAYGAGSIRPRQQYELTSAGADALPVLHALAGWAERNTVSPNGRHMRVVCRGCGHEAVSADRCDACGRALTPETTAWVRPSSPDLEVALASVDEPSTSAARSRS